MEHNKEDGEHFSNEKRDEHINDRLELGGQNNDEKNTTQHECQGEDGHGTIGTTTGRVEGALHLGEKCVAHRFGDQEIQADEKHDGEDATEGDDDRLICQPQVMELLIDGIGGGRQDSRTYRGIRLRLGPDDADSNHDGNKQRPHDEIGDQQDDGLDLLLLFGDAFLDTDGQISAQ